MGKKLTDVVRDTAITASISTGLFYPSLAGVMSETYDTGFIEELLNPRPYAISILGGIIFGSVLWNLLDYFDDKY